MTSTEKAQDLVKSFMPYMYCYRGSGMLANDYDLKVATDNAKECALIAVKQLIESFSRYTGMYDQEFFTSEANYWKEVKQEINKL